MKHLNIAQLRLLVQIVTDSIPEYPTESVLWEWINLLKTLEVELIDRYPFEDTTTLQRTLKGLEEELYDLEPPSYADHIEQFEERIPTSG